MWVFHEIHKFYPLSTEEILVLDLSLVFLSVTDTSPLK